MKKEVLYKYRGAGELKDYSPLLGMVGRLRSMHMLWLVRLFHRMFSGAELRNLRGNKPSLAVFKLYKLGFFACI